MVSTHLKNISQNGSFPQVGLKIKNIWNHHPGNYSNYSLKHNLNFKLLWAVSANSCNGTQWCQNDKHPAVAPGRIRLIWPTRPSSKLSSWQVKTLQTSLDNPKFPWLSEFALQVSQIYPNLLSNQLRPKQLFHIVTSSSTKWSRQMPRRANEPIHSFQGMKGMQHTAVETNPSNLTPHELVMHTAPVGRRPVRMMITGIWNMLKIWNC